MLVTTERKKRMRRKQTRHIPEQQEGRHRKYVQEQRTSYHHLHVEKASEETVSS
jgi:hypothetical protein